MRGSRAADRAASLQRFQRDPFQAALLQFVREYGVKVFCVAAMWVTPLLGAEMTPHQGAKLTQPPSTEGALRDVRSLVKAGMYNLAEKKLRSQLAASPGLTEARFLLGFTLFKENRAEESLATFTEAAKGRSPSPEEFVVIASDYILLQDFADAARWLTVAKDQAPGNVSAWYLLGRTEFQQDHAVQARDAFLKCLELNPQNVQAEYNLGLAYERLQQPEKAMESYRQAINMTSTATRPDPQPYLDLGILLQGRDKSEEALPLLRRAVELAPKNPSAHEQLALCLEKLGQDEEAAEEMLRCVQLAPDVAAPSFLLGRIYRRLGRADEAKAQFARAARLSGTHSSQEVPNPSPEM